MKQEKEDRSIIKGNAITVPCIEKIKKLILKRGLFGWNIEIEYYEEKIKKKTRKFKTERREK